NSIASTGIRPTATAHCSLQAAHSVRAIRAPTEIGRPMAGAPIQRPQAISTATAPNDSQKPPASNDHGSIVTTAAAASSSTRDGPRGSRAKWAAANTLNIRKVRRAGTPQPASWQYNQATSNAAM